MILPILIGTILYIAIGMLYYSPLLFGSRWVDLLNIRDAKQPNYGLVSLVTLFTVAVLYSLLVVSGAETALDGAFLGFLTGLIVVFAYSKDFLFGLGHATRDARTTFMIGAGYHLIALTAAGTVMSLF
ncbi:DUF1761 domain-containing protein [Alteribacter natronophilus]|uniref:DUF1761 domain-containing protein n=1 Tax=Alteribacter natronophilus TaxID=2583810 RepID=UPI00110D58D0|nr:DUF1761 domain-containing protein [Alteribacter natronophilus]TMW70969.1 DUF1761 domain-containing protein [Alteribacter natronophilus]